MMSFLVTTADFGARFIGEIVLLTVAAVFIGFATYKLLPPSASPKVFAALVPFLILGILAYLGSLAAATAVVIFVVVAVVAASLGIA